MYGVLVGMLRREAKQQNRGASFSPKIQGVAETFVIAGIGVVAGAFASAGAQILAWLTLCWFSWTWVVCRLKTCIRFALTQYAQSLVDEHLNSSQVLV